MKKKDLQPSELKIMNVVWEKAPIRASEIANILSEQTGWSKNTVYTMITRMIEKRYINRTDPGFVCDPAVSREEIQRRHNRSLLDTLYNGSAKLLFARILGDESIPHEDLSELREMLEQLEQSNE